MHSSSRGERPLSSNAAAAVAAEADLYRRRGRHRRDLAAEVAMGAGRVRGEEGEYNLTQAKVRGTSYSTTHIYTWQNGNALDMHKY